MSLKNTACIAGAYEHPIRRADDKSVAQLHAEVARGALADAGLAMQDVDGYFCAGDAPGLGALSMVEYLGLKLRHVDTTETGGSSYVVHVAHAAAAIAAGRCNVALITLAGRPKAEGMATGTAPRNYGPAPDVPFELPYAPTTVNMYAMAAMRHMHEHGTTSEQLAWIRVAASHHAQSDDLAAEHARTHRLPRGQAVLGCRGRGQVARQALQRVRRAPSLPARRLPVLRQREHRVAAGGRAGHDLQLQHHATCRGAEVPRCRISSPM